MSSGTFMGVSLATACPPVNNGGKDGGFEMTSDPTGQRLSVLEREGACKVGTPIICRAGR